MSRNFRSVHVRGQEWKWRYGYPLIVIDPNGKQHETDLVSCSDYEDNYPITPRDVVRTIDWIILGYDECKGFPEGVLSPDFHPKHNPFDHLVRGPRGRYGIRVTPIEVFITTPEGVKVTAGINDIFEAEFFSREHHGDALFDWTLFMDEHGDPLKGPLPYVAMGSQNEQYWVTLRSLNMMNPNFKALRDYLKIRFSPSA